MKIGNYLDSIAGVEIYPIVSFVIFILFFIAVTIYVIRLDKNHIKEMSNFPVSSDEEEKSEKELFRL